MKLTLLCIGRTRERFVQEGIAKYLRYLHPYADVGIRDLREEKVADLRDAPLVRKREAEKILKAVPPAAWSVALDERGREFTSHEFAQFLNERLESGVRDMVFIVGGAMGLDESVVRKASAAVAMSRWTFTHEMARLVLLEQLYRAFTIIKG
ncbi:MAG TPA: 23S rRNA (pseudouridine(1915)-N(3))-methyltransferase RlmH, partial [Nitrospirota bacterium]|nr:23S rRNA (pseudouridine(1915)-N(3))-methyltransferase RlmH [Nitrospirota bacterium]